MRRHGIRRQNLVFAMLGFGAASVIFMTAPQPGKSLAATLIGDLNGDGRVDITDLSMLLSNYGKSVSSPSPSPSPSSSPSPPPTSACPTGSRVITGGNVATEVASTPIGGTLCLNGGTYSSASAITINRAMTLQGINGAKINLASSGAVSLLNITAANVTIRGLALAGPNRLGDNNSCSSGNTGVSIAGVSGVTVTGNALTMFHCGIMGMGSRDFTVSNNTITSVHYVGIGFAPGHAGSINGNKVTSVCETCSLGANAYGIVLSGSPTVSTNVTVQSNEVRNATSWECYDTHDGQNVNFFDNLCTNPGRVGFNIAYSGISDPISRVEGNAVIDEAGGPESQWNSIVHTGDNYQGTHPVTGGGTVLNNNITGFGGCLILAGAGVSSSGNTCN